MTTETILPASKAMNNMTESAKDFERTLNKSIGLGDFFEKFDSATLNAMIHRKYLKEGAKFNAVDETDLAKLYRDMAKSCGEKASEGFGEADIAYKQLIKSLDALIEPSKAYDLVRSGTYDITKDRILNGIIKPSLLNSSLPVYNIKFMWADIKKFLDDFRDHIRETDGKLLPFPALLPAQKDLDAINYKDKDWEYCDKQTTSGEPATTLEAIAYWKNVVTKVGRWVVVAVCIAIAIFTCNWAAIFQLVNTWMEVEEVSREFCGWICPEIA